MPVEPFIPDAIVLVGELYSDRSGNQPGKEALFGPSLLEDDGR